MSKIAIRTKNLTRDFGSVRAVDDLGLEIPAGIVFGFLGPNGSGKTTTIRLLLGLLEPARGRADDLLSLAGREGVTIFLTTHNLTEAEKLCGQVGVIRAGRLLAVGHPDQLRTNSGGHQAVILGRGFGEQALASLRERPEVAAATFQDGRLVIDLKKEVEIAPLIGLLVKSGAQVEEAHKGKASLEEVFLSLMEEEK